LKFIGQLRSESFCVDFSEFSAGFRTVQFILQTVETGPIRHLVPRSSRSRPENARRLTRVLRSYTRSKSSIVCCYPAAARHRPDALSHCEFSGLGYIGFGQSQRNLETGDLNSTDRLGPSPSARASFLPVPTAYERAAFAASPPVRLLCFVDEIGHDDQFLFRHLHSARKRTQKFRPELRFNW
jgi:hypothetical protein